MPPPFTSIKQRKRFMQATNSPHKMVSRTLIVQHVPLKNPSDDNTPPVHLGITATKKLGNAVIRNRIKRQLREVFRLHLQQRTLPPGDYVLIGRYSTYEASFTTLQKDLATCLRRLAKAAS